MQVTFLWMAVVACLVTFGVHTFIGGVFVARPLLADRGLPRISKWINYLCWHITTVAILAMGVAYAYSAMRPERLELAIFASGLTAAISILSAAIAIQGGFHPLRFPSTSLLAVTSCLGILGLWVG